MLIKWCVDRSESERTAVNEHEHEYTERISSSKQSMLSIFGIKL